MDKEEAELRLSAFLQGMYPDALLLLADLEASDERGVWLTKKPCLGAACRFWRDAHSPMIHKVVYTEPELLRPSDYFRVWDAYNVNVTRCRLCGGRAHLTNEDETMTFHYPSAVETRSIVVVYSNCAKCGRIKQS